jgi:hypothetical protein
VFQFRTIEIGIIGCRAQYTGREAVMTKVSLKFLASQNERILQELADARKERAQMRTEIADVRDGLTVLTDMALKPVTVTVQASDRRART